MEHITVSELNRYVKTLLEQDEVLRNVTVSGEISNLSVNKLSGHTYFVLKDSDSVVRSVCFRGVAQNLRFSLKEGTEVFAFGRISLYERDGQYQLIVSDMLPKGEGELNRIFEELRKKLLKEGLFDEERKLKIIKYPKHIAVVTAKGSAALADITKILSRRYPMVKMTVFPVFVQGMQAERSIVKALQEINTIDGIDTVIVARGGGSKEDLFVFNSESIVRTVSVLKLPLISAVGHETDITLLDLVADLRASTPSAAAELSVPDINVLSEKLFSSKAGIMRCLERLLETQQLFLYERYENLCNFTEISVKNAYIKINDLISTIVKSTDENLLKAKDKLQISLKTLEALNPINVLKRGYTYADSKGKNLSSIGELNVNDSITLIFKDGKAECVVKEISEVAMHE